LNAADQRWLRQHRPVVLHAAADLSFRSTPEGEPRRTNVEGTAALVQLCRRLGLRQFHYISTAFVCGRRSGIIREDELVAAPVFHNPYEASKWEAERLLRDVDDLETTVYRPAVIVGESDSGYAMNFTGLYRIAEFAVRLAEPEGMDGRRRLPLRVPLTGDEPCHVVPVDWVSRAVVELLGRMDCHGRTYHLTGTGTTTSRLLYDAAAAAFRLEGVQFAGPEGVGEPSRLEEAFWEGVQEYWPYLGGTPPFDDSNTRMALPDLPAPVINQPVLERMFRFAEAAGWGRRSRRPRPSRVDCANYVEQTFPLLARHSPVARAAGLDVIVGLDVRGHGGGQWSCKWAGGELREIQRGLSEQARVTYQLDVPTFAAVTEGRLTPQQAFYERRLDVCGDLETGMKLAVLFTHLLSDDKEAVRACSDNPTSVRC
jgi:nucleoside-diphosphate-sugar epimerase